MVKKFFFDNLGLPSGTCDQGFLNFKITQRSNNRMKRIKLYDAANGNNRLI